MAFYDSIFFEFLTKKIYLSWKIILSLRQHLMRMEGKVAVITGASSGIGRALAEEFGKRKARIVIAARSAENLALVETQLKAGGAEVLSVVTDVSREEDCKRLIDAAVERFGGVDILVNNAGISMRALFADVELDVIRRLMDINFWGTVYCTKYALPYLLKSKGSVTGVSSIAGFKGLPGRTGYSASKFAMQGFLETLRIENRKKGLHVLIACPGFTASNIRNTALAADGSRQGESPRDEAKMMQPGVVAEKIACAIEKRKKILILTAMGKLTVFLNKLFPFYMDKMVYNHMAKEPDSPFK
jgi:short-subunit dehydrogenase